MAQNATRASTSADTAEETLAPRHLKTPILLGIFALLSLLAFVLPVGGKSTQIDIANQGGVVQLAPIVLPTLVTNLILTALMAALSVLAFLRAWRRETVPMWVTALFALCWAIALIVWVGAGANVPLVWLLTGTLALSTPIVFGSMAGLVAERSGVVNIAIEGQLLSGAFASALVASLTGNWVVGLLAAIAAGVLISAVLALFAITYWVEQVVVGVVINLIVLGLTNFLYSGLMSSDPARYNQPPRYPNWAIPGLSEIPILGPLLFSNTIIVYALFLLVPLMVFFLFNSKWGIRTRAVGEHPKAADTVGINVNATRWRNVLLSGTIAGFGGSYYTLGLVGGFGQEITSGQGYIALAALIFGRWHPVYATLAAALFGFASNFRTLASQVGANVPSEFLAMVPYIVTVFAVVGFVGQSRPPAASGKPYIK